MSGDGLIGAVGGALAGSETPLGVIPGGRGNDFARVLGIPTRSGGGGRRPARRRDPRRSTSARQTASASSASPASASTRTANRLANETQLIRGNLVYAYAALRTLAGWKPARFTVTVDGERHALHAATRSRSPTARPSAAACCVAPDAELDDGLFDIVLIGEAASCASCVTCPRCSRAPTSSATRSGSSARAELEISASRPFAVYADGEHLTDLPASCGC